MKLKFIGDITSINRGLKILAEELGFQIDNVGGYPIYVKQKKGPIYILKNNE
ncbi:hypothetical protein [Virgibacillus pantothenticus]|uniref:hypothetical protein n=1 Tax=Virgibacillus pantothenticus TaxID=1473 RepID=UPI00147ACFE7|nr:hypothetical protein [Virgibacillus pantothenticus]